MRTMLQTISGLALVGTIAPPLAYLRGGMDLDTVKLWMLLATLVWFAATPFWMREG